MILAGALRVAMPMLISLVLASGGGQQSFRRGLIALQNNHLRLALLELTKAEKEGPSDAKVHNFRGIVLAKLGETTTAAEEYRKSIQLDPKNSEAYKNLGYLEWTQRHLARASLNLKEALKIAPKDRYARYYLGRVELDQGHDAAGLRDLNRAGVPWPNEPDFLLEAAAAYLRLHQPLRTRPLLARLQSLQLSDRQRVHLGSLLVRARLPKAAVEEFSKLSGRNPDASWAQFDLALANLKTGQLQKAISLSTPLTSRDGEAGPWILLGVAYARLKEPDRAIAAFRRAAVLDPNREGIWLDLTHELMEKEDPRGAISAAEDGLAHNPKSYALHVRLGAACMQAGQYPKAQQVFQKLIDMGDPTPTSAIGLAQVFLRTGRPVQAAHTLALAQDRLGPSFLLVYFQGIAFAHAGQPQQAAAMFRQAVHFNPHSSDALSWLGAMQLRQRKVPDAIQNLEKALHLNKGNRQAQRLLVQARAMEHSPQHVVQVSPQELKTRFLKSHEPGSPDFPDPDWEMPGKPSH